MVGHHHHHHEELHGLKGHSVRKVENYCSLDPSPRAMWLTYTPLLSPGLWEFFPDFSTFPSSDFYSLLLHFSAGCSFHLIVPWWLHISLLAASLCITRTHTPQAMVFVADTNEWMITEQCHFSRGKSLIILCPPNKTVFISIIISNIFWLAYLEESHFKEYTKYLSIKA